MWAAIFGLAGVVVGALATLAGPWMLEERRERVEKKRQRGEKLEALNAGIDGFWELGTFFDEGLKQQTAFDLDALERATGRKLSDAERERFLAQQHQANRWTYLGSGLTHPRFLEVIDQIAPARRAEFEAAAPVFS